MPSADPVVLESLPSEVEGVRRLLLRGDRGGVVEALELPPGRAEQVPQGGIFAAFAFDGARILLGPPLARRLAELRPPPLVVAGIALRVLEDLETLHRVGGVHAGLAADGIGVDELGCLRVRPALHLERELSARGDVAALGAVVMALVDATGLEGAGVKHARAWLSGAGAGGRVGFPDARAARQALVAATRGLGAPEAAAQFLAAAGVKVPAVARELRVRAAPTSAPDPGPAVGSGSSRAVAARVAEARRWLDDATREARDARFARQAEVDRELDVLSRQLRERTDLAVAAARALSAAEAEQLVAAAPARAVLFVPSGHHRTVPLPAESAVGEAGAHAAMDDEIEAPEAESVDDERSVDPAVGIKMGAPAGDAVVETVHRVAHVEPEVDEAAAREEEAAAAREAARFAAEERAAAERRAEAERAEAERAEAERAEAERAAADEAQRAEAERAEAERAEAERAEAERAEAERAEAERAAADEARRAEAERAEAERAAAERAEAERAAEAARRAEFERRAAERAAAERALAEQRAAAQAGGPGDETESFDDDEGDDVRPGIARWEGAVGVTGDASRMHEKGPGKWTLQGRSMADLAEQLPPGEARALDMTSSPKSPLPWGWIAAAATAAGALAWILLT